MICRRSSAKCWNNIEPIPWERSAERGRTGGRSLRAFARRFFQIGGVLRRNGAPHLFSEDLDFSLTAPDPAFDLKAYFPILESEIRATGLHFTVEEKVKSAESNIRSAFLKGNTKEHILSFFNGQDSAVLHPKEVIRIKFEVDIAPPAFATFETKYRLLPSPYEVRLYDLPSLFAGKIHAVLCRAWKNRIKGRASIRLCLLSCKRGGGQSGASEGAAGRFRIDRGRVPAGSG